MYYQCFLGIFSPKWPVFRVRDGLLFCPYPQRPPRARFRRSGNLRRAQLGVGSPHVTLGGRTGFSFAENFLLLVPVLLLTVRIVLVWIFNRTLLVYDLPLISQTLPLLVFSFFSPSLVFNFSTKVEFFASVVPKGKRSVLYLRAEYACARVSGSAFLTFLLKPVCFL